MRLSPDEAQRLVAQQRIAHRLLVGLYRNLMIDFNKIAQECGYTFMAWDPEVCARPCAKKDNPANYWGWDLLPFYASWFAYRMQDKSAHAVPGDCILVFRLFFDEGFYDAKDAGEPDPVQMSSYGGCIEVILCRCIKGASSSCSKLFEESAWRDRRQPGWQNVENEYLLAHYQRYPLENFLSDPSSVLQDIQLLSSPDYSFPPDAPEH